MENTLWADKQQLTCVYKASCFVFRGFLFFFFLFPSVWFQNAKVAQYESPFFISLCWHLRISRLALRASPGIVAESTRRRLEPPPCQRLLLGNTLLMRAGLGTVLGISYTPVSESGPRSYFLFAQQPGRDALIVSLTRALDR